MNAPLVPCPSCQRHVRITEGACPFCGAPATEHGAAEDGVAACLPLASRGRLSSLALMTFRAAAIGAALTACGGGDDDDDGSGGSSQAGASTAGTDSGGASSGGTSGATFGGGPTDGGGVAIYRATPRG